MYIDVLTQIGAKAVDNKYTYHVPNNLKDKIKVGIRVKIPFGKNVLEGFVMGINNNVSYDIDKASFQPIRICIIFSETESCRFTLYICDSTAENFCNSVVWNGTVIPENHRLPFRWEIKSFGG